MGIESAKGYLGRKLCEFQDYMNDYRWDHVTPNGIDADEGMILLDSFASFCENGKVICADGIELRADSVESVIDDMRSYAGGGLSCIEDDMLAFADRLEAINQQSVNGRE